MSTQLLQAYNAQKQELAFIESDLDWLMNHDFINKLVNQEEFSKWKSLDVLYHLPRVERVYQDIEIHGRPYRLCIHLIHPVDDSSDCLFHFHSWGSAVKIISGSYRMDVGYGNPFDGPPPISSSITLEIGSSYSMTHPYGWHAVQPLANTSLSIMLMARPYPKELLPPTSPEHDYTKNTVIAPARVQEILEKTYQATLALLEH